MTAATALLERARRVGWRTAPIWTIAKRVDRVGFPDAELLSVYRDWGVVRKSDREDNFNVESDDLSSYKFVKPGDLVLNKMKTWQGSLAVSDHEGIVSPAYFTCELAPTVYPRFIHYLLRSDPYIAMYAAASKGIRPNQWDLPYDEFRSIPAVLPTLEEQRRIADFLDDQVARIDGIVAAREAQVVQLDESVLNHARISVSGVSVAGNRRASGIPWAPSIPAGWGSPRICQLARMGTGHTPSRSEPLYWTNCDIPWLTTADVHRFRHDEIDSICTTEVRISEMGLANSAAVLHPAGTVALSRTASAGFSVVMDVDMATSQDYATWTCGPLLLNTYLLWCLRAMREDLLKRLAMGSTHKTIYFPDLMSIRVPLPSFEEQSAIASEIAHHVGATRAAMSSIRRSIELLNEYKRSLITAAVTGELDVTTSRPEVPA